MTDIVGEKIYYSCPCTQCTMVRGISAMPFAWPLTKYSRNLTPPRNRYSFRGKKMAKKCIYRVKNEGPPVATARSTWSSPMQLLAFLYKLSS